jgi:O-acetyl-ADP-ribose deacetylase (regulator of RNase III)
MSTAKFSYASITSKNIPPPVFTDDSSKKIKVPENASIAPATIQNAAKLSANGENFPTMEESKSVVKTIKKEAEATSHKVPNVDSQNTQEATKNENDKDFIEQTKRSSNKNSPKQPSLHHDNNSNNAGGGDKETRQLIEKTREEETQLKAKYKDVNEETLCFKIVKGNLFTCSDDTSIAHCVSEDLHMGAGIAVEFKRRFGGVKELLDQKVPVGGCGWLMRDGGYVFYLVTKKVYSGKPLYSSLEQSLRAMFALCEAKSVTKLAMPLIGAGLDRLEWDLVARIINDIFGKSQIKITIYKFDQERRERDSNGGGGSGGFRSSKNETHQN